MRNFLLCGGDDKNLVESFAWGHDWRCLDSFFLLPNALSSNLNAINMKILKGKFMQSLSAFLLFFFSYKKILLKILASTFIPWLLNSLNLPSHGSELWKRHTLRLLLMSRDRERDSGGVEIVQRERGQMTYLREGLRRGVGGTRAKRKLCLITLSI